MSSSNGSEPTTMSGVLQKFKEFEAVQNKTRSAIEEKIDLFGERLSVLELASGVQTKQLVQLTRVTIKVSKQSTEAIGKLDSLLASMEQFSIVAKAVKA